MAFWRKPTPAPAVSDDPESEILFLGGEDADTSIPDSAEGVPPQLVIDEPLTIAPGPIRHPIASKPAEPVAIAATSVPEPIVIVPSVDTSVPSLEADRIRAEELAFPLIEETATEAPLAPVVPEKVAKKKFSFNDFRRSMDAKGTKDEPGYLQDWRRGAKGRPAQLFIGFLPDVTKKDAVSFALGIAQRHGINAVNCSYAVYKHATGWAYEVHEGGPRRAYLPKILKEFDEQAGGPLTENSLITIETAQRRVRVERTQSGLTAFWMPEGFSEAQTSWLEPGSKMKPAATLLFGLIWFGGALFAAGFLTLIIALIVRPDAPPLNASARTAIPYEMLPSSQWQGLLQTYTDGYAVDSLKWTRGKWVINRTKPGEAPSVTPPPPPAPSVKAPAKAKP